MYKLIHNLTFLCFTFAKGEELQRKVLILPIANVRLYGPYNRKSAYAICLYGHSNVSTSSHSLCEIKTLKGLTSAMKA